MGGKSHDGPWNTPQASHGKDETPEADRVGEDQEDDTTERRLYDGRARLDRKLSQNHLSRERDTMLDDDEEENSKMLLNLDDTGSFTYDLGDYLHDDPEDSLDPLHSRDISMAKIQDIFLLLCNKAVDPTSWVDPKRLPSMFRFALHRPLMPERELHWNLAVVGIDPSLGFLDPNIYNLEGSHRRPREILKGIMFNQEEKGHVSRRFERLPKGLCLLTSPVEDVDDTGSAEDEPTDEDEMIAELWNAFNGVEAHKIRLEDAPTRYRDILSAFDCSNDELAAWLEDFEIPSDHIDHGSHQAELSEGPDSPSVVKCPILLKQIARLVQLHRSKDIRLEDFLSLLRGRMAGFIFNEDVIMGYVRDSSFDAEAVADLLLRKSNPTASSGDDSAIAAQKDSRRSRLDASNSERTTLGDSIKQDLEKEFAAIHRDVVYSHISFDDALAHFRDLLGDPEMSNAVLSRKLVAYGIPPDLFFGGENLDETPPKLDGSFEEAQITRSKKPRITLRLPARPSSPTSPRDLNLTSAASCIASAQRDTADHVVTQEVMPKTPPHDDYDATLSTQAAKTPGADLKSSPVKPNIAASFRGISSAEQQSLTTQSKQQPEQHRKDGSCQTDLMTRTTQGTHSTGSEKTVNLQDLVPTTISTDPADPHPEPVATNIVQSIDPPTFVQPLLCHRPDKSRQNTEAKPESPTTRARTLVPITSMPLSVLSQRRNESIGIEWKRYATCFAGNPSKEFYDRTRLSVSPEKGTSVDLFGLPIPTKDARNMAKAMKLPPDFAEKRIRSTTPRRVSAQKFEKATSKVTLPSPKRKSSATSEPGNRKMRKQEAPGPDMFAAEGQDHDDFIRSLFTPEILNQSGLACGWCLEAKCLCNRNKESTEDVTSEKLNSIPMARDTRPLLLEQPPTSLAKSKHRFTTNPSPDEAVNATLALASIARKYQITLDTLLASNLPASDETANGGTEHGEVSSKDDSPTMKCETLISEATDQRSSGRGNDTAPPPEPRPTFRDLSPVPATRYTVVDDVGLMSPVSHGSSFSYEPIGLTLSVESDLGETAAPNELISPLSQCSSSSFISALRESSGQAESEDTAGADRVMPSISRRPPPSSEPTPIESPFQTKEKVTAVPDELLPPLSPRPPPTPRPRALELPSEVLDSCSSVDERPAEQSGSGGLHRGRASIRAATGLGTRVIRANKLKAQRRRYKLLERRKNRQKSMTYAETLDRVLEEGRRERKSYFVVMAELRHKRIQANLRARQYRFFQTSNGLPGPSGQTVAISKLFDKYRGSRTPFNYFCYCIG